MRKIVLFIAMSLDGCIANASGGTEWLEGQIPGADDMTSYEKFILDVDTVVMGANTYRQLATELSPKEWVYSNLTSYVVTHSPKQSTDKIRFTDETPCQLIERLKTEPGKDVWICGGANVAQQLIRADLIDQYCFNIIPTILGGGISLFDMLQKEIKLKLLKTRSYNGITDLVYERR